MIRNFERPLHLSPPALRRRGERGAALVLAILVLAILTVIGIALMLVTSTESRIAANEWTVNRAFYASDAGIRWATAELVNPQVFMMRPEFTASPFGSVLFTLPSHRNSAAGFFAGDSQNGTEVQVKVQTPSALGRRLYVGGVINAGSGKAQYVYAYEVRATASNDPLVPLLQYSKTLVSDIEMGPLPEKLPF
jgi:PilX N-terminal